MVMIEPGFEPLPPYSDPRIALKKALPALRPAEDLSVTESAEKYMMVKVGDQWQDFRRDVAPYMVEPTDMIASRSYRGLAFCGPSQSGKTQMLQSALAWTIASNPGRVALFQMTRDAAEAFERDKFSPMIRNSPELEKRKATGRGADNLFQKLYLGGTHITLDWPTVTKLSSQTIRLLLATDYDHFPESIGGEGDAYTMMRARARSFRSRGMVVVESSPGAPVKDECWRPISPHDCVPVSYGVLSLYPEGTRGRWYWPCPNCDEVFEPTFKKLRWPDSSDFVECGEAAEMVCPHCGCPFGHHLKRQLNDAGEWLHETSDGGVDTISSGNVRRTDLLSYWLDGAAAAFASWSELVVQELQAREKFERTGDEEALKTAANTGQAQPYLPRGATSENEVTLQGLKDKSQGIETPKAVAPSWTRYITVSVDTQGNHFDVGATAWGEDGRHQPIDRFEIIEPPEGAPMDAGDRSIKPFEIAEDWAALEPLANMVWPVEGEEYGLRAAAIGVDLHGGGSTTENAYRFYRKRRKAGQGKLWFLTRGHGGKHQDRVWLRAPERVSKNVKGRRVATDIEILNMATDRLKDAVSTSLIMVEAGQNQCLIPLWMPEPKLVEFTAERRTDKGWEKRPGMVRNESFDHLVQARALHIHLGGEKVDWSAPFNWACHGLKNVNAVAVEAPDESGTPEVQEIERPKRRRRVPKKIF
ncbi:terminase gpA endonuclease subunit [Ruegeria sp. Ofav3-42]|uniref:terminase gpA endonuclease subunit n=1 Tax=Ruegeria sp. Ofav3-42 TaxID=2917759 RepID=UPI001EF6CC53|nr:terminase gpA endonuclease subunit [Ruegeria sp. Ofav3-42]MCG7520855.1 phage terminase large subunit family protein [Ruegeria sp. Ofav3-42]